MSLTLATKEWEAEEETTVIMAGTEGAEPAAQQAALPAPVGVATTVNENTIRGRVEITTPGNSSGRGDSDRVVGGIGTELTMELATTESGLRTLS
jgi:hypothetical protein